MSDGQFGQVLYDEVTQLKRVFANVSDKPIRLSFIIVTKRHHARFFPMQNEGDKKGNVKAGTCVDQKVVHPFEHDFYLNSHAGLQGTSRSAHYHLLYDEHNFDADRLQKFSYRLCYLYARCTKSVSIVPPVYYADLLATRAKCWIDENRGASGTQLRKLRDGIAQKMFFV